MNHSHNMIRIMTPMDYKPRKILELQTDFFLNVLFSTNFQKIMET